MHARTRELLEHLDRQRAVLRAAFDDVPRAQREEAPAPGRWSAAGIIEHLSIVESRQGVALSARLAEAREAGLGPETSVDPVLPTVEIVSRLLDRSKRMTAPDVAQPTGLGADAAWSALERGGASIRETLLASDGLALGTVIYPHPLLGPLSLYHWFAFVGAHEARHAAQIRADFPNRSSGTLAG